MPETAIGFHPDIGSCYAFSRMPGAIGTYLALTGNTISPGEALVLGLAKHYIQQPDQQCIIDMLANTNFIGDPKTHIFEILEGFASEPPKSDICKHAANINLHFSHKTVEEIIASLAGHEHGHSQYLLQTLQSRCP